MVKRTSQSKKQTSDNLETITQTNGSRTPKRKREISSNSSTDENNDHINKDIVKEEDIKEELMSDEEYDASQHEISDYELIRKENMKKNREMFEQFNVTEAKHEFAAFSSKKKSTVGLEIAGLKRPIKKRVVEKDLPRRASLRLQKIKADLDALPKELPRVLQTHHHNYDERKPSEIKMELDDDVSGQETLKNISGISEKYYGIKEEPTSKDLKKYKKRLSSLHVSHIGKVIKSRIYAVTVHPTEEKTLAFISGKEGDIGIWDVGSKKDNDGILRFEPHSSPINCLKFLPHDTSKIFSCSYDGTIRCGDLVKQQFNQVFGFDENIASRFHYFDWPCNKENDLYAVTSDGELLHIDIKTGKCEGEYRLNKRSCKCIDFHPTNENIFSTCCVDGSLATWDRRKIKDHISYFKAGKSISTGFFSAHTGQSFLLTSQDDYLRVFDVDRCGKLLNPPVHQIRHDNYVTRWLTTFRAAWDPKTDNCFVCGSMARPRQIDLYCCGEEKELSHFALTDEEFTSVNSVVAFHPSKDIIVGGNSSGKVFVWS